MSSAGQETTASDIGRTSTTTCTTGTPPRHRASPRIRAVVSIVYTELSRQEMIEFLPPEVVLALLSHCDYAAEAALTMTCTSLNRYPRQSWYRMEDLLQIERWPCYDVAETAEDHMKQPLRG